MTGVEEPHRSKRVLFIDDEAKKRSSAAEYVSELIAQGWLVRVCVAFQEVVDHLKRQQKEREPEDLVVLDMMLPVPVTIAGEPIDPLSIGNWILRRRLRTGDSPYLKTPVLVLTNRDCDEVQRLVEGVDRTWVRHKFHIPPFHLPQFLREILQISCEMS